MKSTIEWKKWGEVDPRFGVSTWNGKSMYDVSPWTDEELFEMGKSDWEDFKRVWCQYGLSPGTCVEIGSGVGRITKHLVRDFASVKAIDVSDAMLQYAKARVLDGNVEFLLSDGAHLPVHTGTVDAVFSTHVFQHFDDLQDASNYFYEMSRVLRMNGSFMVHLPIYRWPGHSRLHSRVHRLTKLMGNARAACYRFLIKKGRWYPFMRNLSYELDWLFQTLDRIGYVDVELRVIRPRSNSDPHSFVLGRKRN